MDSIDIEEQPFEEWVDEDDLKEDRRQRRTRKEKRVGRSRNFHWFVVGMIIGAISFVVVFVLAWKTITGLLT